MGNAISGSPWLVVTLAVISALGTGLTAALAPAVVEWFVGNWVKERKLTGTQPALAVPAQQAADAIDLIRKALDNLTNIQDTLRKLEGRVLQLEDLKLEGRVLQLEELQREELQMEPGTGSHL